MFLTLNTYVLEKERWATTKTTPNHTSWRIVAGLLLANALSANLWLGQIHALRKAEYARGVLTDTNASLRSTGNSYQNIISLFVVFLSYF